MTAVLAPSLSPFTDATCRQPARLARWWDDDARSDERKLAAALCEQCPALTACGDLADTLGAAASGTWAGQYRPWAGGAPSPDDEAMTEFLALFGPSAATSDNPIPTSHDTKPRKHGRYWIHPAQLRLDLKEAN